MKHYWWLSFADPVKPKGQRFLGVIIVECPGDMLDAIAITWSANVNPGGEVQGWSFDYEKALPLFYTNRLLTWTESQTVEAMIDPNRAKFT